MDNQALEKAVIKIYEQIAETGLITDNKMALIMIYERKNKKPKKDSFDQLLSYGNKVVNIINKNLKE